MSHCHGKLETSGLFAQGSVAWSRCAMKSVSPTGTVTYWNGWPMQQVSTSVSVHFQGLTGGPVLRPHFRNPFGHPIAGLTQDSTSEELRSQDNPFDNA
jgi:hypothetical protein